MQKIEHVQNLRLWTNTSLFNNFVTLRSRNSVNSIHIHIYSRNSRVFFFLVRMLLLTLTICLSKLPLYGVSGGPSHLLLHFQFYSVVISFYTVWRTNILAHCDNKTKTVLTKRAEQIHYVSIIYTVYKSNTGSSTRQRRWRIKLGRPVAQPIYVNKYNAHYRQLKSSSRLLLSKPTEGT